MKLSKAERLAPEAIASLGQSKLEVSVHRAIRRYVTLSTEQQELLRHAQRINFVFNYLGIDEGDSITMRDTRETVAMHVISIVCDERRARELLRDGEFRKMLRLA